jgi:hypothetical protein
MAKVRATRNGRLEEALTAVLQTQASMQQAHATAQQNISTLQQTLTTFLY